MTTLHRDFMNFSGPAENLATLAAQYDSWICNESAQRLAIIENFQEGTEILTESALASCMDALIGIAHLNLLADLAAKKHGDELSALRSVTLPKLESDFVAAQSICRDLDQLVTGVFKISDIAEAS